MWFPKKGERCKVKSLKDLKLEYAKNDTEYFTPENFQALWRDDKSYNATCETVITVRSVAGSGSTPIGSTDHKHYNVRELEPLVDIKSIYD